MRIKVDGTIAEKVKKNWETNGKTVKYINWGYTDDCRKYLIFDVTFRKGKAKNGYSND